MQSGGYEVSLRRRNKRRRNHDRTNLADLVYIDQAKDEVGILMNPGGGTYISFKCGGEPAEGQGSFLAPVGPINQEATSFTATLSQLDSVQTPDEYEGEKGEPLYAFPTGEREGNPFVPTGVESKFTIHSNLPGEIKAVTAQDIEAEQREEEAKQLQATLKKQEAVLRGVEEHAKQMAGEAKMHEEEVTAQLAATVKKDQEEVAATKKQRAAIEAKLHPPTRAELLAKALKQCKKQPKNKRAQCEVKAQKKYGHKAEVGKK